MTQWVHVEHLDFADELRGFSVVYPVLDRPLPNGPGYAVILEGDEFARGRIGRLYRGILYDNRSLRYDRDKDRVSLFISPSTKQTVVVKLLAPSAVMKQANGRYHPSYHPSQRRSLAIAQSLQDSLGAFTVRLRFATRVLRSCFRGPFFSSMGSLGLF
jgi:hypothetical protein